MTKCSDRPALRALFFEIDNLALSNDERIADELKRLAEGCAQAALAIINEPAEMSALGHKRTFRHVLAMSALPPKVDIKP